MGRHRSHHRRRSTPQTPAQTSDKLSDSQLRPSFQAMKQGLSSLVKFCSAISAVYMQFPVVQGASIAMQNGARQLLNTSFSAVLSHWIPTNHTDACQNSDTQSIADTCLAYMNNVARAAVDIVWEYKRHNASHLPDSQKLYDCITEVLSTKFPILLNEYWPDVQDLTADCQHTFSLADGHANDKVQVHVNISAELADALCKEISDKLMHEGAGCLGNGSKELILICTLMSTFMLGCFYCICKMQRSSEANQDARQGAGIELSTSTPERIKLYPSTLNA